MSHSSARIRNAAAAARDGHALLVEQLPGEHLVPVDRTQRLTRAVEQRDQLTVGEIREGGDLGEHVVDLFDEVACQAGQRGAQPTDRPRDLESPHRGPWIDAGEQRTRTVGFSTPSSCEIGCDVAVHLDHDGRRGELLRRGTAADAQDFTDRVLHRLDPEVELERREHVRERLGDRSRAEDRTGGFGVGAGGGDRPALQHDDVVVDDRPLDVLRTAEHRRGALLQRDEVAHVVVDFAGSIRWTRPLCRAPSA